MLQQTRYGLLGGLLSSGAPLGFLALRLARRRDRVLSLERAAREVAIDLPEYAYITVSTAIAFTLFGYLLGRQADRLAALSETDALTGLYNARGLWKRLHAEAARSKRYREPLALLLVDLDRLKSVNDLYGHRAGDLVLRRVADAIRSELRATDVGARWGGDEFAILAPNTSEPSALALAERVRTVAAQRAAPWQVTTSLGVATIDPGDEHESFDGDALMRAVDAALYEAKQHGRNRVAVAPSTDPQSRRRIADRRRPKGANPKNR